MDNNIYQIIRRKNMTQAKKARKLGIIREYMNRIIHQKITPTIPLLLKCIKTIVELGKLVLEVIKLFG